ncbi:MAG: cadmium, cobalt and zinc/H(+)-K(+) antiporter [Candidatus Nitrosocaldaceae archaeon]|nr:MAG: cadmium, cobalt and zinc/H(+)-K(+) antiporter [Candidatus Nitrosocaldaceae archaeon]
MHRRDISKRLGFALLIGASIGVLEVVGGILSNSIALISDAGHMFTDVIAIAMSLFALRISLKPHTPRLTYGYHRAEVLAALANGIVLLIVSAYIIIEAYNRFFLGLDIEIPTLVTIASIGLFANIGMLFILKDSSHKNINVKGAFLHILSDTLSSIAIIISGIIIYFTGIVIIDPILAIIISGLIIRSSILLLKDSVHILLEGVPKGIDLNILYDTIKSIDGVSDVHDLHVWCITTDLLALSAHVIVKDQMISESTSIIDRIRSRLLKFGISHVTIQIEPEDRIKDIDKLDKDKK